VEGATELGTGATLKERLGLFRSIMDPRATRMTESSAASGREIGTPLG